MSPICRHIRNEEYVKNAVCILKMLIVSIAIAGIFMLSAWQW